MSLPRRVSLAIRKQLPGSARHLLRLGKLAIVPQSRSQKIPAHLVSSCRVCASRYDLVAQLPRGGVVAELGTARGRFAKHILSVNEPASLHLIDLDFSRLDPDVGNDARVTLHAGMSAQVIASFPDAHFDWIYIDADHSYAGASKDALAASPKVKPGGYLVFNDFAHMDNELGAYGVHRAVSDFAVLSNWPFVWFAFHPQALYDVALQRPT